MMLCMQGGVGSSTQCARMDRAQETPQTAKGEHWGLVFRIRSFGVWGLGFGVWGLGLGSGRAGRAGGTATSDSNLKGLKLRV